MEPKQSEAEITVQAAKVLEFVIAETRKAPVQRGSPKSLLRIHHGSLARAYLHYSERLHEA
jgi:hypothetical protein